jgi:lipoprotein-releasing system permease protein
VFNGFEDLLSRMVGGFKADLQLSIKEGKVFSLDSLQKQKLAQHPDVAAFSLCLEEVALFEYKDKHNLGLIRGVDEQYRNINRLDTLMTTGTYRLKEGEVIFGVAGSGLEYALELAVGGPAPLPLAAYMPKRNAKSSTSQPFKKREIYIAGIYSTKQGDYDNYVITDLDLVRDLLSYEGEEISSVEIAVRSPELVKKVQAELSAALGAAYVIKDRYEQDATFFKITNMEKWVGYLIFSFTLLLVAFNMVGALWMLVLEKKKDILILQALGATRQNIRNIFLLEGLLMSAIGAVIGIGLAVLLCVLQQQYGLVRLQGSGNFIIETYPVSMRWTDFVLVFVTVLGIGGLAAYLPAMRAARVDKFDGVN